MDTLTLLPNLEILRIEGGFDITIDKELGTHLAHTLTNLKQLRCHFDLSDILGARADFTAHHYLSIQGLKSFSGVWSTLSDTLHLPSIDNRTITNLCLEIHRQTDLPTQGLMFPALKSFGVIGIRRGQTGLIPFLEVHGPQITALFLCFYYDEPGEFETQILDQCPAVEELVRRDLWPTANVPRTYPSIVRFGVAYEIRWATPEFINAEYHLDRFPNLQVVQLLATDYESPSLDCTQKLIRNLLSPRRGLRFEDAYGRSIPDPNAEI